MAGFTRITGAIVARAAASDFRSFHRPEARLKVEVKTENVHLAALRTNSEGSRIAISHDMAGEVIESPERLFFHLLIVCHEIAHLVHRHNDFAKTDRETEKNLEFWADFYSGKAFITLLTYGRRVGELVRGWYPGRALPFPGAMEPVGKAVGELVNRVYNDDPRYPPRLQRAGLVCNGITSALRHELRGVDPIWYFSVIKRVLLASATVRELAVLHPEHAVVSPEQIDAIRRWHREAQGDRESITTGLKPQFLPYLHTTFDQTDQELAEAQRERRADLGAYYDLDPTPP